MAIPGSRLAAEGASARAASVEERWWNAARDADAAGGKWWIWWLYPEDGVWIKKWKKSNTIFYNGYFLVYIFHYFPFLMVSNYNDVWWYVMVYSMFTTSIRGLLMNQDPGEIEHLHGYQIRMKRNCCWIREDFFRHQWYIIKYHW